MANISSKKTHFLTVASLLHAEKDSNDQTHDGILLITSSSLIYGKIREINIDNPGTNVTDILMSSRKKVIDKNIQQGNTLIGDGSSIVIEDATIKYSNNITLNMKEIIIFTDQIIGYYPINISDFDNQFVLR